MTSSSSHVTNSLLVKIIPNIVTALRIPGAAALVFLDPGSAAFWIVYSVCGLSDMLDGFLARKLDAESSFGATLDSVSDLALVIACAIRVIPEMVLSKWIWILVGIIAATKLTNVISSIVIYRKVLFPHTLMNKVTGLVLFLAIPAYFLSGSMIPVAAACSTSIIAAIQEGHLIRTKAIKS